MAAQNPNSEPDLTASLQVLERLIAFDTTSRNSNLELIQWVEAYFAARGVAFKRIASADGAKASLIARIGPEVEGGVVLSGHTDVVPVDGQDWASDPWTLSEREGKLYGRGTADMKGFIALALAHVDAALKAPLQRPLMFALSYDEEIGCLAAPELAARVRADFPAPAAVIVGEPSDMKVISGHKGIRGFFVEVEGLEAHSSQVDQGVSAVMQAVKLMQVVADEAAAARASADASTGFEPPGATLTIGRVEGGTASNILARRCWFMFDLRWPPEVDANAIEARFRAAAAKVDAEIKTRAPKGFVRVTRRSDTAPLAPDRESTAEQLARALTGDNSFQAAAFAAEAGAFQGEGLPAVICGPGSITQAHQPDEWVTKDQLAQCARFMQRLIAHLSA
jgi:acetylornithine deacetylase